MNLIINITSIDRVVGLEKRGHHADWCEDDANWLVSTVESSVFISRWMSPEKQQVNSCLWIIPILDNRSLTFLSERFLIRKMMIKNFIDTEELLLNWKNVKQKSYFIHRELHSTVKIDKSCRTRKIYRERNPDLPCTQYFTEPPIQRYNIICTGENRTLRKKAASRTTESH